MDKDVLPTHNFEEDSIFLFILYTALLAPFLIMTLYLKPFRFIEALPRGEIFNIIIAFLAVGALFSIIYLTPYAIASLSISASEVRRSLSETIVLPQSILTTIAVGFPTFYFAYAFIFYVTIIQKRGIIIKILMLLGVLSFVVNVFTFAGRDGVLFSSFALVLGYFFFEPLLKVSTKKTLKKIFILSISFALFLIIGITAERFSNSETLDMRGLKVGIVGYLGMQPYIFNDWVNYNDVFNHGHSSFKMIVDFFGIGNAPVKVNNQPYTWMFGTFLTSFYAISGFSSLLLVTFGFWFYFKSRIKLIRQNRYYPLGVYFFLGFFFHFVISGMFYFRLGNSGGNLFMLLSILAVFLFRKRKIKF
ncbi:O-antigen polymerase [Gillisia sp. Hel_I_86]|uniref:O-antigen polymerase n=1 Tax=Gillisia sp. Hel_I_86 TaxID=1249981 RepID=UPI0016474371|nr:O-antigen polymerase [Gillisia sp. Hel_I_86]